MARELIDYRMAYADDYPVRSVHDDDPDMVEAMICEGWQPFGSPVVVTIQDRDYIKQAMVLYVEAQDDGD